ncbi:MAG: hypothetical protein KGL53_01670, partial [Elusimicrobia bacterium]|nr:hypothetical protein [Elusimicrobiota bacterium]
NSEHLKAMIDDLLETTRAETGKLVVEPRRTDAGRLAAEVAAEKRLAADQRGVRLACEAPAAPFVFADPVRVRQVLMNFVDNALKFTPSGGTVSIACAVGAADPGKVTVSVTDTGPGLPPDDCRRIFDRLYQARDVRPLGGERKGLGLGLYISREIVLRSGGRIWVESEPGKGASFRFTLPQFRFEQVVAPAVSRGARRAAVAFVELYPPSHGMAEGSARTVRLECAALLRRQAREGESLLPEMSPPGAEGMLVYVQREPSDSGAALAERLQGLVSGVRVVSLHRLKPSVQAAAVEAGAAGLSAALESAIEGRLGERLASARESGVVGT